MEKDHRAEIMMILSRHVGKEKAIGMGELFTRVYGIPWRHRINDTRKLREEIKDLRKAGALIGETRSKSDGGYYLARSISELNDWIERRKREAIKKLAMIAAMKKIGLPELLGQMQMNLRGIAQSAERIEGEENAGRSEETGECHFDPDDFSTAAPGRDEPGSGTSNRGNQIDLFGGHSS